VRRRRPQSLTAPVKRPGPLKIGRLRPTGARWAIRPTPNRTVASPLTADTIVVRRPLLEYPDDLDPAWNHRAPEFAFAANSVSMLMPYAEPYFVHSTRAALTRPAPSSSMADPLDAELRERAEAYVRQESQHHAQHRRFNDLVVARHPALRRVEGWIERTYGWLDEHCSLKFNLAFAAGSEAIAFSLARWAEDHLHDFFVDTDPVPASLFLWHLAEEVEHKSVAFDLWKAVDGSRRRYVFAMSISFVLLAWFSFLATLTMLFASGRWRRPSAWVRLVRWAFGLAFTVLPDLAVSATKRHHPTHFADPVFLTSWLSHADPETGALAPLPH
jgi:predicted metal-dependent hydrolase